MNRKILPKFHLQQPRIRDCLWAALCMMGAVNFIFR